MHAGRSMRSGRGRLPSRLGGLSGCPARPGLAMLGAVGSLFPSHLLSGHCSLLSVSWGCMIILFFLTLPPVVPSPPALPTLPLESADFWLRTGTLTAVSFGASVFCFFLVVLFLSSLFPLWKFWNFPKSEWN